MGHDWYFLKNNVGLKYQSTSEDVRVNIVLLNFMYIYLHVRAMLCCNMIGIFYCGSQSKKFESQEFHTILSSTVHSHFFKAFSVPVTTLCE